MGMNLGAGAGQEPEVMMDINTTPLIDVMLVLLIMLIITIPAQLHSVNMDMPQACGMSMLTECSCAGMVMINMMSSTSITSISGVVLMSIITSGSCPAPAPRFMPMPVLLQWPAGSVMKLTLAMPARCTACITRPTASKSAAPSPRICTSG